MPDVLGGFPCLMVILVRLLQALAPALYHSSRDVRLTGLALIVANVVPLLGVIFAKWDPSELLFLYWLETLIVGVYTLCCIILSGLMTEETGPKRTAMLAMSLFLGAFFTVHYGGFNFGHGIFLTVLDGFIHTFMSDGGSDNAFNASGMNTIFDDGFIPLNLLVYVLERTNLMPSEWLQKQSIFPAVVFLILSHGFSFVRHDLQSGNIRKTAPMAYMFRPYGRIILMHVFIIVGFMVFLAGIVVLGKWASIPLLALWIGMKLHADLRAHARFHEKGINQKMELR